MVSFSPKQVLNVSPRWRGSKKQFKSGEMGHPDQSIPSWWYPGAKHMLYWFMDWVIFPKIFNLIFRLVGVFGKKKIFSAYFGFVIYLIKIEASNIIRLTVWKTQFFPESTQAKISKKWGIPALNLIFSFIFV